MGESKRKLFQIIFIFLFLLGNFFLSFVCLHICLLSIWGRLFFYWGFISFPCLFSYYLFFRRTLTIFLHLFLLFYIITWTFLSSVCLINKSTLFLIRILCFFLSLCLCLLFTRIFQLSFVYLVFRLFIPLFSFLCIFKNHAI